MSHHSLPAILVALLAILIGTPSLAQQNTKKPLTVIQEWRQQGEMWRGYMALSPDGLFVAHIQVHNAPGSTLFLQNTKTGADPPILSEAEGLLFSGCVSFAPDGKHLAFTAGNRNSLVFSNRAYTARTDGSDLIRLAPGDPSTATYCKANLSAQPAPPVYDNKTGGLKAAAVEGPECTVETRPASSSYSPDGSKLMVEVITNPGKRNQDGWIEDTGNPNVTKRYIAVVSAHDANQEPERLVQGAQFWSADGDAVYYFDGHGATYRFDLQTKESTPTGVSSVEIIDKVPGADAVFVHNDKYVGIASLQSTTGTSAVSPELAKAVARVPIEDSEGRGLIEIQAAATAKRLLLIYSGTAGGGEHPWGDNYGHAQLVSFQ